ncbi:MAG: STAS domain-containing protein [Planctomycetota bacterium]|jgi:anti-anti-sigma factor
MQQISVEDRDGTCWITLRGDLDQQEVLDLKARFDQGVQSVAGDVVVDLSQVTFIGTLGIGLIVSTHTQLQGQARALKLAGVPAAIEKTFETMSLAEIFDRV